MAFTQHPHSPRHPVPKLSPHGHIAQCPYAGPYLTSLQQAPAFSVSCAILGKWNVLIQLALQVITETKWSLDLEEERQALGGEIPLPWEHYKYHTPLTVLVGNG